MFISYLVEYKNLGAPGKPRNMLVDNTNSFFIVFWKVGIPAAVQVVRPIDLVHLMQPPDMLQPLLDS